MNYREKIVLGLLMICHLFAAYGFWCAHTRIKALEDNRAFYGKGDIIELCDSIAEAKLPRYTVDMQYFGALESFVLALGEVQRGNMKGKDMDIYYQFFATYTELKELEANNEQQK